MSETGTNTKMYLIQLCDLCVSGAGGECHSPGCAMWINRAPDLPLRFPMILCLESFTGDMQALFDKAFAEVEWYEDLAQALFGRPA